MADAYDGAQSAGAGPSHRECEAISCRPLLVVVLTPDPEVVFRRDVERDYAAHQPGHWTAAELDQGLREDTTHLGLWIDNSTQSPEETVDEILRRWHEAVVSP